jgi:acetoin utilization protein AcuC
VRTRYNIGGMECPLFEGLWERACASVGGSVLAARLALEGSVAFHPAGGTHHGRPGRASGFCYFNDPVFAILTLLDAGVDRLLYVDLDAHHGDGVEEAFADDPRVQFFSIHEEGRWPGTGDVAGALGARACNVPVPRGISDAEYAFLVNRLLRPMLGSVRPEAVVVTLGADGLAGDPLSAMELSNSTLWETTELCVAASPAAVVLGGGGYNPWTTVRLWAGMWARLSGQAIPPVLPHEAQAVLSKLDCDLVDEEVRTPSWIERLADEPVERDVAIRPQVVEIVMRCLEARR